MKKKTRTAIHYSQTTKSLQLFSFGNGESIPALASQRYEKKHTEELNKVGGWIRLFTGGVLQEVD